MRESELLCCLSTRRLLSQDEMGSNEQGKAGRATASRGPLGRTGSASRPQLVLEPAVASWNEWIDVLWEGVKSLRSLGARDLG